MTVVTSPVTIRIRGLSVYAHHGAQPEERSLGQRFEFDVDLYCAHASACSTDNIEETVDYSAVAALVAEVATDFHFNVLEALAEAVCLELLTEFPVERVRLEIRKPAPPLPHPVASVGIEVERTRLHLEAAATGGRTEDAQAALAQK